MEKYIHILKVRVHMYLMQMINKNKVKKNIMVMIILLGDMDIKLMILIQMKLKQIKQNYKREKSRFKINLDFFSMFALTKKQNVIKYNKIKNVHFGTDIQKRNVPKRT